MCKTIFLVLMGFILLACISIMLFGCTTFKVNFDTQGNVTSVDYKYFLQNKQWSYTNGTTSVGFDNNNQPVSDMAIAIKALAEKIP